MFNLVGLIGIIVVGMIYAGGAIAATVSCMFRDISPRRTRANTKFIS